MAPFLRPLTSLATRGPGAAGSVFRFAGLAGLVLVILSSCSRVTYVFSPSPSAYLGIGRPAPGVPRPGPPATARADSLPATSRRSFAPVQGLARQRQPLAAQQPGGHRLVRVCPSPAKIVAKRLAKLASRGAPRATAGRAGGTGFISLATGLKLIVSGLVALLIGAAISTNIIGAIFGVFFITAGALLLAIGLLVLLIALVTRG